jgi:hypothetical protein
MKYYVSVTCGVAVLIGFYGLEGRIGRPISDRDAQGIIGGGCNSWTSGTVACNGSTSSCTDPCNSVTFSSLITNGSGQNIENVASDKTCFPCSNTSASCGTAHVVTSTKNGNCGT